jgi:hypothetical protein
MKATDQTRDPRDEPQKGEGSDPRNARSLSDVSKVETALDSNQQSAGDCRADIESLCVPINDQKSLLGRLSDDTEMVGGRCSVKPQIEVSSLTGSRIWG